LYAIANKAAVSTEDGQEVIITGDDIPEEFLENAKRIGREALKVLPQLKTPNGEPIPMTLIRTDVGCSDSPIHDVDYKWDPNGKTFFLNEIEYGGTTYFIRHLKFDSVPLWATLYAEKAREIASKMPQTKKKRAAVTKKKAAPKKVAMKVAKKGAMKVAMKVAKKGAMKVAMKVAMKAKAKSKMKKTRR